MLSELIQVCSCEVDKLNCYIPNKKITIITRINDNVSLPSVGNKDGLTKGVITFVTTKQNLMKCFL